MVNQKNEEKKSHKIKSRQKEKLKARQIVILKHIARYQIDIKICRKRKTKSGFCFERKLIVPAVLLKFF